MAIKLTKAVKREMLSTGLERGKNRARAVIVSLLPGDMIEFRAKGTRQAYSCYLGHCFRLAQSLTLEAVYNEKVKTYNQARKYKKGLRRPKRPLIPFNKIYFQATKND